MISDDLPSSHETQRESVEIPQDNAITIQDAVLLAANENFSIGKSTIQRWAKSWYDRGTTSPVKCILVSTRTGTFYRLDRDDFTSWLIEQKNNVRPGKVLQDPERPHETPKDPERSQQTSRDPVRSSETSRDFHEAESSDQGQVGKLREEIMNLKIDIGIRKELVNQAAGEINRLRQQTESLLVEKGALQFQLLQLAAPAAGSRPVHHEYRTDPANSEASEIENGNFDNVDNPQT